MNENTNAIVNYDEIFAEEASKTKEEMQPAFSRIAFRAGRILIDEQDCGTQLCSYILAYRRVNTYYGTEYNPDEAESPKCWSICKGKKESSFAVPNPASTEPQSDLCSTCPKDAFGSARNGKSKACKNRYRLMIIPAAVPDNAGGYQLLSADALRSSPTYVCNIPPTSLVNFEKYVLASANGRFTGGSARPIWGMSTCINLTPDPRSIFKVNFSFLAEIPGSDAIAILREKAELADQAIDFGYDYEQQNTTVQGQASSNKF